MVRKAKVVREGKEPFRWCATSQNPARRAPPSLTCCSRAAWAPTEVGGVRACVPRQRARARLALSCLGADQSGGCAALPDRARIEGSRASRFFFFLLRGEGEG